MFKEIQCESYEELSKKAAEHIGKSINKNSNLKIALPGGRSIAGVLRNLAKKNLAWYKVNFFLTDERKVPSSDLQSNLHQLKTLLLNKVDYPYSSLLEIENGVEEFTNRLIDAKTIDLCVLGVGEDGHVASLFPKNKALEYKGEGYLEVNNSPKPPKERITLAPASIKNSKEIILLFTSASKEDAFEKFIDKSVSVEECPAKLAFSSKKVFAYTYFGDSDG